MNKNTDEKQGGSMVNRRVMLDVCAYARLRRWARAHNCSVADAARLLLEKLLDRKTGNKLDCTPQRKEKQHDNPHYRRNNG